MLETPYALAEKQVHNLYPPVTHQHIRSYILTFCNNCCFLFYVLWRCINVLSTCIFI